MANESTNSGTISRVNQGFPPYLDFDALRTSSIDYLSGLTGKVWTDYNVHDPGITILEMLIYAMMDLGYRTNLPAIDLFTQSPEDDTGENNFFTPGQVLSCNPLTITDFRKLLVDIEGVKNAWLTIAEDVTADSICSQRIDTASGAATSNLLAARGYINGLYHVSLELDAAARSQHEIIDEVKTTLLAHRNLCEDFVDISVLCPLDIGICADIILDSTVNAEEIYRDIVVTLHHYFSPAPVFYTLQQLLDKHKSIEDIFSGRPFNYTQSHGFVDTAEFEAIVLKQEIHLSDVYNILMGVRGVVTVRKLKLRQRDQAFSAAWQFVIPDRYIPRLALDISSLNFSSNGTPVAVELQNSDAYFKIATGNTGKVLQPAAHLDLEVPKGVYHNELAEYYSIQHEFPLVYGIGEGGLPESASPRRKAQALQLKGYLLFFDQLLANYLSQLANIRSIFSLKNEAGTESQQTYFLNDLTTVPDFSSLIRDIADERGKCDAGARGDIVAYPVNKKDFHNLLNQDCFSSQEVQQLQRAYNCNSKDNYKNIAELLQNEFGTASGSSPILATTSDNGFFYYMPSSTCDIILTGKVCRNSREAATSVGLLSAVTRFPESYHGYLAGEEFTFDVRLNLPTYQQLLHQVTESKSQYRIRRQAFLDHLLSRFAEQFTDFALLSYGFMEPGDLTDAGIVHREQLLSQYPMLSSTRGKAFNYRKQYSGYDDADNRSGFEKRAKAFAGIHHPAGARLCNFDVIEYEDAYAAGLQVEGFRLFNTGASYEGLDKAQASLQAIFTSLADTEKYRVVPIVQEEQWQLQVQFHQGEFAFYPDLFVDEKEALELGKQLQKMFTLSASEDDIVTSRYEYRLQLTDNDGKVIRLSADAFETGEAAYASLITALRTPNDTSKWQIFPAENNPTGKFWGENKKRPELLVDIDFFKIDIDNNIVGKPDKYTYELLDKENSFKFRSVNEFDSESKARTDCYRLLVLMLREDNYQLIGKSRRHKVVILNNGQPFAESQNPLESANKAVEFRDRVCAMIKSHCYHLTAKAFACRWKYNFQLGFKKGNILLFVSDDEFESIENARVAAENFNSSLVDSSLVVINARYSLKTPDNSTGTLTCTYVGEEIEKEGEVSKISQANKLLALQQKINQRLQSQQPIPFGEGVEIDDISKTGRFVFRLVDKDRLLAAHAIDPQHNATGQVNTLFTTAQAGYQVLDIYLGGEITEGFMAPGQDVLLYRYCLKCFADYPPFKKGMVLFKSTRGYPTPEAAEAAFNSNYLVVLSKAIDAENYGPGEYISLGENCPGELLQPVVFIPGETRELLPADDTECKTILVEAAMTYPIRALVKCGDEFRQWYREHDCGIPLPGSACEESLAEYVYGFHLFNNKIKSSEWRSVTFYESIEEAKQDFDFFTMLLKYKGNYYLHTDYCQKQTVYIREVLAESSARFMDEATAWGENGVEKLICIAQTNNSVHASLYNSPCRYSFEIACDTTNAIHPCKYDTAAKRDKALDALYKAAKEFDGHLLFKIIQEEGRDLLYGMVAQPIAVLPQLVQDDKQVLPGCARVTELLALAANRENFRSDAEGSYWLEKKSETDSSMVVKIAFPYDSAIGLDEWREQLLVLAFYYPVKIKDGKYCVEVKFPGLHVPDNLPGKRTNGCNGEDPGDINENCYQAWQSACCYTSCMDAMNKYESILPLLNTYSNYRPFFDCTCYSFGIALQQETGITAYNPQHYVTPDMVCKAIQRAKQLINAEGMHLVEHILLRPGCANDCACKYHRQGGFTNPDNCENWIWKAAGEAGKQDSQDIIFTPGADPFSFIATVVLPAWPRRFRKKENRDLLEAILHREAPAHVLLRILWLKPADICKFEALYGEWKLWLLQKKDCDRKDAACNLLYWMFETDFNCLNECTDCLPCVQNLGRVTCDDVNADNISVGDEFPILNDINRLFGWKQYSCDPETKGGSNNITYTTADKLNKELPPATGMPAFKELSGEEAALLNTRLANYKQVIAGIYKGSDENPLAERAKFALAGDRSAETINALLTDLHNPENKAAGNELLNREQREAITRNLVWAYLDKVIFFEKEAAEIKLLAGSFDKLRAANVDLALLFDEWKFKEIEKFDTAANINVIRQVLLNQ